VAARSDGRGSEFLVRLPLAPAGVPRRPQSPAPAASAREWNLRGVRALVLDDEHDTRVMLAAVLASAGVTVSTAGEVGEALALLDTQPHDIVISDIGMPRQDGYAFARQLRQHPRAACRELPAIALTAYARPEDRIQALASGFQAHLAKPAQPEELLATVASLVGRAGVAS
jgi:CheY-like chemotaxis protein